MKKYYTPSIEEFRVGFEFEVLNTKDKLFLPFYEEGVWFLTKLEFGILGDLFNVHKLILEKQIRVKYLDKEDIVSKGFTLTEETDFLGSEIFTMDYQTGINHFKYVKISKLQQNIRIEVREESGYDNRWYFVFNGDIKNKSELEVLLKQLNIICI
jgi:hypothetical protein